MRTVFRISYKSCVSFLTCKTRENLAGEQPPGKFI